MMDYYPHRKYYIANGSHIGQITPHAKGELVVEAESLKATTSSGDKAQTQDMRGFGPFWSGGAQILVLTNAENDFATLAVPVDKDGMYAVSLCYTKAHDFAQLLGGFA